MWQKIFSFVIPLAAVLIIGCSDNSVSPQLGPSSAVTGETEFVHFANPDNSLQSVGDITQVQIFRDISDNEQLSGLRKVLVTYSSQGKSYGTFSMVTKDANWEGNWTGTTTSSGTNIKVTGYDKYERGKTCVWYYYFPSSQDGKTGTFTARINYERD